ncbi:MAG TPA: GntR family transcriptional regulator, partial [Dokdonella sp.]
MTVASLRPLAYLDLRSTLQRQIESGALTPGLALPGERELAQQHAVSRVTVRKAIEGLVADGLLVQRQGSGTFVSARIVRPFSHLTSFSDELRARGLDPRSETLASGS